MSTSRPTPWGALLQAALKLGLTPDVFWRLSVREWHLLSSTGRRKTFGRSDLSRLMASFPDAEVRHG